MGYKYSKGTRCCGKIKNVFVREFLAEFLGELNLYWFTLPNTVLDKVHLCWSVSAQAPQHSPFSLCRRRATSSRSTGGVYTLDVYLSVSTYAIVIQLEYRCFPWHGHQLWSIWRPSQSCCLCSSCILGKTFLA